MATDVKPRHFVFGKIAMLFEKLDDTVEIALAVFEQRLLLEKQGSQTHATSLPKNEGRR
jgi:hypothetical protein